jgi:lysophospholipase L1-like esterase
VRKVISLIIGICFSQFAFAQSAVGTYSFIKYDENRLLFDKDSSTFMELFKKMTEINGGDIKKMTIVHIGGSHVQGGTWSNSFLEGFQQSFNVQGGGYFVFPYKLAKTNGQPYARSFGTGHWKKCRCVQKDFCLPLGMNGMSVGTNDSANTFGVSLTNKAVCRKFNSVKIYHNFNCSFELNCTMHVNKEDCRDEGYTVFEFDRLLDSVVFQVHKTDTMAKDFTLYGFSLEDKTSSGFYLAGLGANGASSNSFLRCNLFVSQLKTIKPDLVVLSLGVNDVQGKGFTKEEFIQHYDSLITMVKEAAPNCAILLTTTTDNYIRRRTPNKRTETARDALIEVMKHHQCAVWDMYEIMGGFKSISKWYKTGLAARDKVHFSPKGYKISGILMFEALYKSYTTNQKIVNK